VTPAWILDVLATLMLVVAAVSVARIAAARVWRRDAVVDSDLAHLLMATAMAGMLSPGLATLPGTAWEVVFGLLAVWFAGRVLADARRNGFRALAGGHCAPHLVHSGSMLYMFLAASPAGARPGAGLGSMSGRASTATMTLSHPTLAFAFAFVLVGYAIWDLDQLSGRRYATGARVSLAGAGEAGGVGPLDLPALAGAPSPPLAPSATAPLATAFAGAAFAGTAPVGTAPADAVPAAGGPAPLADEHATSRGAGEHAFLLSPAVTVGCRITMSIVMAFMLLIAA
jgi:hypothetical protein